jgi:phosphate/sulfate permease
LPTLSLITLPNYWIIFLSATRMVAGMSLYGQKLTLVVTFKIAKLSASRGFSVKLATALVITVTAQYGFPSIVADRWGM